MLTVAVEPVHKVVGTENAVTVGRGRTVTGIFNGVTQPVAPLPVLTLLNTNVVLAGQVAPSASDVGVINAVPAGELIPKDPFTPLRV